MVRKSLNAVKGIKVNTVFHGKKYNSQKHYGTAESEERIMNCLNCTKPAKDCKGDCYGKDV